MTLLNCESLLLSFLKILSHVTFKYDSKSFKTSNFLNAYCFCIAVLFQGFYCYVSTLNYMSMAAQFDRGSETTQMIHFLVTCSLEMGLFPILVNAFLNQKNQVTLLNKLLKVEESINLLKYQFDKIKCYRKFKVATNASMISVIVYFIVLIYIFLAYVIPAKFELLSTDTFIQLFHTTLAILFNLIALFMIFLVKIIIFLFKTINLNLEQEIEQFNSFKIEINFSEILKILKIHKSLKKTMFLFSKSFGITCLGIFLHNVGMVTCVIFLEYITLRNFNKFMSWRIIFYDTINFIWFVPLVFLFGILSSACEKVFREAEKASSLLENINGCNCKIRSLARI